MLIVFWDSRGVVRFQKHGEHVHSASYCEILLKLQYAIRRKGSGQLARGVGYCFVMRMLGPIQASKPGKELKKNYIGTL
jgi:hypothetical protein